MTHRRPPHVLLVNPWIHDFAAYDFWAKPYGLLLLGAMLRAAGLTVSFIDCLDRFHPKAPVADGHARGGRGPYLKTRIAKPPVLAHIPRHFCRYGIPPDWLAEDLDRLARPDLILVTSLMTYWYPGVAETIAMLKDRFADVPVVLGGVYASLCTEHARAHSGADRVVAGRGEAVIFDLVKDYTGWRPGSVTAPSRMDDLPYPAFDLQRQINYIPVLTGRGCPFNCDYCASGLLEPGLARRSPVAVVKEILYWHRQFGVTDFAFYDDALLVDADRHARPILEGIVSRGIQVRFHTPNAIHIRAINAAIARLMRRAGFCTLRLGLETTAFENGGRLDRKVTEAEFYRAVGHLKAAGFSADQVGAYLLVGLPDQTEAAVIASIDVVKAAGITPVLAHYTPIPGTALWTAAVSASPYDLAADPVLTNNAIFPCRRDGFSWQTLSRLKQRIQRDG